MVVGVNHVDHVLTVWLFPSEDDRENAAESVALAERVRLRTRMNPAIAC